MSDWISVLSAFAIQVPVLLACIAALAIALSKPTLAPEVKKWALAGFGLTLVLCFAAPAMQFFLLSSIRSGNTSRGVVISGGTALLNSVLHAASYLFLRAAIVADRFVSHSDEAPATER